MAERVSGRALRWPLIALLMAALDGCAPTLKEGIFGCTETSDCPAHQQCDVEQKICYRRLSATRTDPSEAGAGAQAGNVAAETPDHGDAGREHSAGGATSQAAAGGAGGAAHDATAHGGRAGGGSSALSGVDAGGARAAGHGGGAAAGRDGVRDMTGGQGGRSIGGAGASAGEAGGEAAGAAAGDGAMTAPTPCPENAFCYDFEAGVLGPGGTLWASPAAPGGGAPTAGQLATLEYPAGSGNHVLVATPSAVDAWPKATVGHSPSSEPFSRLEVSFDFAATETLSDPALTVVLFRFTAVPGDLGVSVDLGLDAGGVQLASVRSNPGASMMERIAPAAPALQLLHVSLAFERTNGVCTVSVEYGDAPAKTLPTYCDLSDFQVELGLNVLRPVDQPYTEAYAAYYDNLRVVVTR